MNRIVQAALVVTCVALVSAGSAHAVQIELDTISPADSAAAENAPLFQAHDLLEFTIETDFKQIKKDRDDDAEEREGRITFPGPDGSPMTLDIKVRTRGNYRLQKRNCRFPPLRLNFKTKEVEGTIFESQDKLKLVTHCQDKDEYEQFVLQEYNIYRVYNLFTNSSLRARLARITYIDTSGDNDPVTKYGVVLEHWNQFAARHRKTRLEFMGLSDLEMDLEVMPTIWVFQYMMANTDWEISALHNIELLIDENQIPLPVPYDFDWAGVVGTPYAKPDPQLDIRNVRDRLFRGYCIPEDQMRGLLDPVFAQFNEKKDEVYALYENTPGMEPKRLEETTEFFDKFYETINDDGKIKREFIRKCRRT